MLTCCVWQFRGAFRIGAVVSASFFNLIYVILVNLVLSAIIAGTYLEIQIEGDGYVFIQSTQIALPSLVSIGCLLLMSAACRVSDQASSSTASAKWWVHHLSDDIDNIDIG